MNLRSTVRSHFRLALLLALTARTAFAGAPPLLQIDLRDWKAVGLQVPEDENLKPGPDHPLTFIDNSTLAVSFPVFNPNAKLTTRDHPVGGSILLRTRVVEIPTGQVTTERTWASVYLPHEIAALSGGRTLVRVGNNFGIYSRDWQLQQQYHLGTAARDKRTQRLWVSPSGETVFVIAHEPEDRERIAVMSTSSSQQWHEFAVTSSGRDGVSDSDFAFVQLKQKKFQLFVMPLHAGPEKVSLDPKPIAMLPLNGSVMRTPWGFQPDGRCTDPVFIRPGVMILAGMCDRLSAIGTDGTIKAQKELADIYLIHKVRVSRDQQRFAFMLSRPYYISKPGEDSTFVYLGAQIRVCSTDNLSKIFTVDVTLNKGEIRHVDLALSPDGSLLAVVNGWTLAVYKLQTPQEEKSSADLSRKP